MLWLEDPERTVLDIQTQYQLTLQGIRMTKDNITILQCVTRLDIPVERVLEQAQDRLETIVIMGWDKDGDLYFASSVADGGEVLWLMELCKKALLNVEVPS